MPVQLNPQSPHVPGFTGSRASAGRRIRDKYYPAPAIMIYPRAEKLTYAQNVSAVVTGPVSEALAHERHETQLLARHCFAPFGAAVSA